MAIGSGTLTLEDDKGCKYTLKNWVYVPDAKESLLSEVLAPERGLFITWT